MHMHIPCYFSYAGSRSAPASGAPNRLHMENVTVYISYEFTMSMFCSTELFRVMFTVYIYLCTLTELKRSRETTIEVDLRKFNVPYEFGLKSNEVADLKKGFDHTTTVFLHSSKEKAQYSFHAYVHPTESGM